MADPRYPEFSGDAEYLRFYEHSDKHWEDWAENSLTRLESTNWVGSVHLVELIPLQKRLVSTVLESTLQNRLYPGFLLKILFGTDTFG